LDRERLLALANIQSKRALSGPGSVFPLKALFNHAQEYVTIVFQRLARTDIFGLVANGTQVGVMETVRGKYAKKLPQCPQSQKR